MNWTGKEVKWKTKKEKGGSRGLIMDVRSLEGGSEGGGGKGGRRKEGR